MPSAHVWPNFGSLPSPHCLNQAPPGAQQLRLPDFLAIAHFGHASLLLARCGVIAVEGPVRIYAHELNTMKWAVLGECVRELNKNTDRKTLAIDDSRNAFITDNKAPRSIIAQVLQKVKILLFISIYISQQRTFAGLDALGPCMIKAGVTNTTAFLEPGTTGSAAAELSGFGVDAALRA